MKKSRFDFNVIISDVLRYGVIVSSVLITIGIVMILLGNGPADLPRTLEGVISVDFGRPASSLSNMMIGVVKFNPIYIIQLGLLILLATPIVRVGASILLFAFEKDALYVALTVFVLAALLFSIFVIGPIEAVAT